MDTVNLGILLVWGEEWYYYLRKTDSFFLFILEKPFEGKGGRRKGGRRTQ